MPSQEMRDALFIAADNRANFKNVIAKRSDLVKFASGRLIASGAGTVTRWEAGQVLGYLTSGPNTGKYTAYDDNGTHGEQTARGVLTETTDVDDAGNGSEMVFAKGATLFQDLLIGLDANGIVDMAGNAYVEHGVNLIDIRA